MAFSYTTWLWLGCLNILLVMLLVDLYPISFHVSFFLSHSFLPFFSLSHFPILPTLPLCSPVTWPRTHLFVTVIWSGWQTTCAPTPSRPAAPAVPALADSQTNALDRSRARSSAAPVGRWLQMSPSYLALGSLALCCLICTCLLPFYSYLFSLSPLGVPIISALLPLPHKTSN